MGECDEETKFEILHYFRGQGSNFIDSANGYREEESEIWLGEWMKLRENRDEIVLATTYSSSYKGSQQEKIHTNCGCNGTGSLRASIDPSLKKLQTTYIDLLYLH
jgi:aryl-alcohol dehydrogenase-like predicted oxidoreductase